MIIKKTEKIDSENYEVYNEVEMTTTDNKKVMVLQPAGNFRKEEIEMEIQHLENEISHLTTEKENKQAILNQINNLK